MRSDLEPLQHHAWPVLLSSLGLGIAAALSGNDIQPGTEEKRSNLASTRVASEGSSFTKADSSCEETPIILA
jgi:hypothetical protein